MNKVHPKFLLLLLACILRYVCPENSCVNQPFVTSQEALIPLRGERQNYVFNLPPSETNSEQVVKIPFKPTPLFFVGFWTFEMFCLIWLHQSWIIFIILIAFLIVDQLRTRHSTVAADQYFLTNLFYVVAAASVHKQTKLVFFFLLKRIFNWHGCVW